MVVPDATPPNVPDVEIVPVAVLELLQVPPIGEQVYILVEPSHALAPPAIVSGNGLTVTADTAMQPGLTLYVMFTTPPATPVTTPVDEPTVATLTLLLIHVPPPAALLNVVVAP